MVPFTVNTRGPGIERRINEGEVKPRDSNPLFVIIRAVPFSEAEMKSIFDVGEKGTARFKKSTWASKIPELDHVKVSVKEPLEMWSALKKVNPLIVGPVKVILSARASVATTTIAAIMTETMRCFIIVKIL